MEICKLFLEDEKPLDTLALDGGFCGIFRTICCIGDSLSSGEFEFYDEEGNRRYCDMYEYSWGQFMARTIGSKVYNFSRAGMTAKEYVESFADRNDYWNPKYACQAYIIALGANDVNRKEFDETFKEYYATIVGNIKEIQPEAKFFFVTLPKTDDEKHNLKAEKHAKILYELADEFNNSYVIDLWKYAPIYDKKFKESYFLYNHLNPCGYILTAKMMMSYIDYIIRHNMKAFENVGFIGKDKSQMPKA